MNQIKRLFSYLTPISAGISMTIPDEYERFKLLFKEQLNRRLNRFTALYIMRPEYSFYELANVSHDSKTNRTLYHLEHCATGATLTVSEEVFQIIFQRS